jgi:hypothetical protein
MSTYYGEVRVRYRALFSSSLSLEELATTTRQREDEKKTRLSRVDTWVQYSTGYSTVPGSYCIKAENETWHRGRGTDRPGTAGDAPIR